MAKAETITDDSSGQEITYPFITARSLRVELSPTRWVWLGDGEMKFFADGEALGKWAQERFKDIVDKADDDRGY